jgi:hypothetical protein
MRRLRVCDSPEIPMPMKSLSQSTMPCRFGKACCHRCHVRGCKICLRVFHENCQVVIRSRLGPQHSSLPEIMGSELGDDRCPAYHTKAMQDYGSYSMPACITEFVHGAAPKDWTHQEAK